MQPTAQAVGKQNKIINPSGAKEQLSHSLESCVTIKLRVKVKPQSPTHALPFPRQPASPAPAA